MTRSRSAARKGGAPKKAPEGLDRVLFVRANKELLDKLEDLRRDRSQKTPGITLSRADIARAILWEAIERGEKERK